METNKKGVYMIEATTRLVVGSNNKKKAKDEDEKKAEGAPIGFTANG